jgi:hypothetical protein
MADLAPRGRSFLVSHEKGLIDLKSQAVGAWLSLVERLVRDQEAGGSNPLAPTKFPSNRLTPFPSAMSLVTRR